jgi:Reversibly glycosylated polypeptide
MANKNMKTCIVIASINPLSNIKAFEPELLHHDCEVIVVDEGNSSVRRENEKLLSSLNHKYYGPTERADWFKKRFGSSYTDLLSVIPERCHAETSFGFLVAFEEKPDTILEVDDDVFPFTDHALIDSHVRNLSGNGGVTVGCKSKWYNTMENLTLTHSTMLYPRGHPYGQRDENEGLTWKNSRGKCDLNMGLWTGCPDLDALTILYHGGMNGQCSISSTGSKRDKIIAAKGTYFPVCSMNTAFLCEVAPAFYQLYSNFMGIDRFDDIWSGVFIKKIADHLGRKISLGSPLVNHRKRPRDTLKDLRKELEGMIINEKLWTLVDQIELEGSTYWDAYDSLIQELGRKIPQTFTEPLHRDFLEVQLQKMKLWLRIIDQLD